MATEIGISKSSVACYFHLFNLQPCRTDSFKLPTDPFFIERLRDLVGLYLSPPDNALDPDGHPNSPVYGHLKLPHLN